MVSSLRGYFGWVCGCCHEKQGEKEPLTSASGQNTPQAEGKEPVNLSYGSSVDSNRSGGSDGALFEVSANDDEKRKKSFDDYPFTNV